MQTLQQKMKILGVKHYRITMRNSIQPQEYSTGGDMEGVLYITDSDGNPNVLSANRNDDGQWVNANWDKPDNQWNDNGAFAFLVSANLFISLQPLCLESFVLRAVHSNRQASFRLHPRELIKQYIFYYPKIRFPKEP